MADLEISTAQPSGFTNSDTGQFGIMSLLLTLIYSQMSLCFQAKNNSLFSIY